MVRDFFALVKLLTTRSKLYSLPTRDTALLALTHDTRYNTLFGVYGGYHAADGQYDSEDYDGDY